MAHLSCVGETTESLQGDHRQDRGCRDREHPRPARRPAPREAGLRAARGRAWGAPPSSPPLIAETHPEIAIGGACFPEVHPEAPSLEADLAYLKTKVENGASFLITQLFFDNRLYFDFVPAARAAGIDVPIIPGIMPMTGFKQIARISELCEATIPEPLSSAMQALEGDERAEFELGVAYATQQCADLLRRGAPGIHLYALNRWPAARAILGALHASKPWEEREPATAGTA